MSKRQTRIVKFVMAMFLGTLLQGAVFCLGSSGLGDAGSIVLAE